MKKLICYSLKEKKYGENNINETDIVNSINSIVVKTNTLLIKDIKYSLIEYLKTEDKEPENGNLILHQGLEVIDVDILAISDVDNSEEESLTIKVKHN